MTKKLFYITRYAGIFFNQDVLYFWQLSLIDKKYDTVVVLRYGTPGMCIMEIRNSAYIKKIVSYYNLKS